MANWNNTGMANVDLECGMECYINRQSIGYTSGDCNITCATTNVDLYQGQPAVKVGSRIAKIEGKITLACLEQTPENMRLASSIGHLVKTSTAQTKQENDENIKMHTGQTSYLRHDTATVNTIVVKSLDKQTTYVVNTDYVVDTTGNNVGLKLPDTPGALSDNDDVLVSYSYTDYLVTPYLFYGAARKALEVEKVVFHKVNPDASEKQHHIIICWRAVAQGDFTFKFNETSQNWMSIGVELGLLSDAANTNERHNLCPLFMETWQDSFDINNLPVVPENYQEWDN